MAHRKKNKRPESLTSRGAAIKNLHGMRVGRTLKENELMSTREGDLWIGACQPCSAIVFRVEKPDQTTNPLKVGWHMDPVTMLENMEERKHSTQNRNLDELVTTLHTGKKVKRKLAGKLTPDEIIEGITTHLKKEGGRDSQLSVEINKGRVSYNGTARKEVQKTLDELHSHVTNKLKEHPNIRNVRTKRPSQADDIHAKQFVRVPVVGRSNHRIVIQSRART